MLLAIATLAEHTWLISIQHHIGKASCCFNDLFPRFCNSQESTSPADRMKSTKVQTLSAITLHTTTDYTDDASILGLGPLSWAIV